MFKLHLNFDNLVYEYGKITLCTSTNGKWLKSNGPYGDHNTARGSNVKVYSGTPLMHVYENLECAPNRIVTTSSTTKFNTDETLSRGPFM